MIIKRPTQALALMVWGRDGGGGYWQAAGQRYFASRRGTIASWADGVICQIGLA